MRGRGWTWVTRWPAPLAVGALHVILALLYRKLAGVGMDWSADPSRNTWDYLWQTIPMDLLKDRFWESIWYSHAQPPLFNVFGLIHAKWFAHHPLQAQHLTQILMGGFISGAAVSVTRHLTGRPWVALAAGLAVALNPVLFLYEGFLLYTLLAAFGVMVTVWALTGYARTGRTGWLVGFLVCLNLLFLTRGLYHLLLLPPLLVILILAHPGGWKKIVLCVLLTATPTLVWYGKNQAMYGFFGTSSWFGSNLYRMVAATYSREELRELADEGILEPEAVARRYFEPPSRFRELGYDKTSEIPVLSRDDFQNINMVDISRMHGRNARALRSAFPDRYVQNVKEAYGRFTLPSHETQFVARNAHRIAPHVRAYEWALLRPVFRRFQSGEGPWTSLYSVVLPLLLAGQGIQFLWATGGRPSRWPGYARDHLVPLYLMLLIGYVTLVSSLYEYGENCRFKVSVEALILLHAVWLLTPGRDSDLEIPEESFQIKESLNLNPKEKVTR